MTYDSQGGFLQETEIPSTGCGLSNLKNMLAACEGKADFVMIDNLSRVNEDSEFFIYFLFFDIRRSGKFDMKSFSIDNDRNGAIL